MLTPNDLVLPFGGSYVFANFGENRSRNATVRVLADGQTDTQTQTDFIICPMLYASYSYGTDKAHFSSVYRPPREHLSVPTFVGPNSKIQCGRCSGHFCPHTNGGRDLAVPAFNILF